MDGEDAEPAEAVFSIFAPTEERAKQLAGEWLKILDHGACLTKQRESRRQKEASQADLAERSALLTKKNEELAVSEKKLEELDDVADLSAEAVSLMMTQQRLIGVELAGVTARLEACEELLKTTQKSPRRDRIDELKVAAEIELVGLTARKQAVGEIVRKGQARVELVAKIKTALSSIASAKKYIAGYKTAVANFESARQANMPFVVQGKISVSPVTWRLESR